MFWSLFDVFGKPPKKLAHLRGLKHFGRLLARKAGKSPHVHAGSERSLPPLSC